MRVFHIFIILVILKLANAKLLKSVFLASFDPLSIDNETEEKFDDDDTVDVADDDEVHGNKSKITMDNEGGKIEFVSPLSTEDSEIQKLATEFFLILKELKELTKEEAKAVLQMLPSN